MVSSGPAGNPAGGDAAWVCQTCGAPWAPWAGGGTQCACGGRRALRARVPGLGVLRALSEAVCAIDADVLGEMPGPAGEALRAGLARAAPGRRHFACASAAVLGSDRSALEAVTFPAMREVTEKFGWRRTGRLAWVEEGGAPVVVHEYRADPGGPSVHVPVVAGADRVGRVAYWAYALSFRLAGRPDEVGQVNVLALAIMASERGRVPARVAPGNGPPAPPPDEQEEAEWEREFFEALADVRFTFDRERVGCPACGARWDARCSAGCPLDGCSRLPERCDDCGGDIRLCGCFWKYDPRICPPPPRAAARGGSKAPAPACCADADLRCAPRRWRHATEGGRCDAPIDGLDRPRCFDERAGR